MKNSNKQAELLKVYIKVLKRITLRLEKKCFNKKGELMNSVKELWYLTQELKRCVSNLEEKINQQGENIDLKTSEDLRIQLLDVKCMLNRAYMTLQEVKLNV